MKLRQPTRSFPPAEDLGMAPRRADVFLLVGAGPSQSAVGLLPTSPIG